MFYTILLWRFGTDLEPRIQYIFLVAMTRYHCSSALWMSCSYVMFYQKDRTSIIGNMVPEESFLFYTTALFFVKHCQRPLNIQEHNTATFLLFQRLLKLCSWPYYNAHGLNPNCSWGNTRWLSRIGRMLLSNKRSNNLENIVSKIEICMYKVILFFFLSALSNINNVNAFLSSREVL